MLDPLAGFDPAPLAAVLADPDDRDRAPRRPPGRRDPAARVAAPTFTNVFDTQVAAGFAGFSAQAGYNGLLHDVLRDPAAEDGQLHALGRAPADRRAARATRAATSSTCCRWPTTSSARLRDARPARVGARGVPSRSPRRPTSATPRRSGGGCRASPASTRASARWRASWRAWRERTAAREDRPVGAILRDPTVVELAKRQPAGRARAGADPRHQPGRRAPPRRRHPRRDRARPRAPSRSGSTRASGSRPRPSTARRSRSPSRSCAPARRRPGWPTS